MTLKLSTRKLSSSAAAPRLARLLLTFAASSLSLAAHAVLAPAQVSSLQALYTSTNGAAWTTSTNWMNGGDPCNAGAPWFGVTCDAGGNNVTRISMFNNNLAGPFPLLTPFPALTALNFNQNRLTGALSPISALGGLQQFSVNQNQLTGCLPSLTGLSGLRTFDASRNQLTGPIPSLAGLAVLDTFHIAFNQLTGPIPALTGIPNVRFFWASNNQLTGSIPSLTGMNQLLYLRVNNNQLTGTLPAAPSTLTAGASTLCPNNLSLPSLADAAWDVASTGGHWWEGSGSGEECWADEMPVVTTAAGSGTVTPGTLQTRVAPIGPGGASTAYTLVPSAGYVVDTVTDNCGAAGASTGVLAGNVYTVTGPYQNCNIAVAFKLGPGGAVTNVPTLSEWGTLLLALLMPVSLLWRSQRRSSRVL